MGKHPWWSVRWWRVALALVIVFGSIYLLEWWIGPFIVARYVAADKAAVLPISQPDSTVSTEPAWRVKRRGISFELPWIETDKSKRASNSGSGLLIFTNGLAVLIDRPPKQLELIRANKRIRAGALRYGLKGEALSSEFALTSAALETTTNDAKWWRTPIYNEKVSLLLAVRSGIKGLLQDSTQVPIYRFSVGGVRGFQVGDLRGKQIAVKLILFDQTDRDCVVELLNFQNVKQAEINALIASLRFEE